MSLVTGLHPRFDGVRCLGAVNYDPGTAVSKSVAAAVALTAFDTTNARITFTAPQSGAVRVRVKAVAISGGSSFPTIMLGVLESSTIVFRASPIGGQLGVFASTLYAPQEVSGVITGLTPGSSHTYDAAYASESAVGTTAIKYGGPDNATANDAWGALQFEVWAEPPSLIFPPPTPTVYF